MCLKLRIRTSWDMPACRTRRARRGPRPHPVVRTHPVTGKKSLFLGFRQGRHFKDMTVEESAPILDYLYQHLANPDFTCRFHWENGAVGNLGQSVHAASRAGGLLSRTQGHSTEPALHDSRADDGRSALLIIRSLAPARTCGVSKPSYDGMFGSMLDDLASQLVRLAMAGDEMALSRLTPRRSLRIACPFNGERTTREERAADFREFDLSGNP